MSGDQVGGVALGVFACLLAAGGIIGAIRRRRRRAEIATTYGETGGIVFTIVQAGCSGLLMLGGLVLIVATLLLRR